MSDSNPGSKKRLYRNRDHGGFLGVCAGLADYFGLDLGLTRLATFIGMFFFAPGMLLGYFALALILPLKPPSAAIPNEAEEAFVKSVRSEPQAVLSSARHRYRELEQRLRRLEHYVTSSSYNLDKEFESLNN